MSMRDWDDPEIIEWEDTRGVEELDLERQCFPFASCRPRFGGGCFPFTSCRPRFGGGGCFPVTSCRPRFGGVVGPIL